MSAVDIGTFLTQLDEARQYRDDLEKDRRDLSLAEIIARKKELPEARKQVAELEQRYRELRGDVLFQSQSAAISSTTALAKPDGRPQIQAEAYEYWIRLKASGANPTVHSICEMMARWCADNNITTQTGITPRAGTIRNTILGGSSGWQPPTHSRDQAREHVAQLAQVAQPKPSIDA